MEPVKFHFDPLCPWCYQTSRWARRLEELGEITLEWGVFSLEVVNLEELAAEELFEFALVAAGMPIRGATGAPMRPMAFPLRG